MPTEPKLPHVFRESFAVLFEQPEQHAALRVMDDAIHAVVWEGKDVLDAIEGEAEPPFRREASGAIGDLRQAIDSIANLGSWVDEAELDREQARLSILAGDVAAELEPFAERLDAALSAYLAGATDAD